MQPSYWEKAPERLKLGQTYHEVASVVGWDRAVEIGMLAWHNASPPSKRRGRDAGRRGGFGAIYVPQKIDASGGQKIVKLIGMEDARRLVAAFPGEQLCFQSIEAASFDRRNRAIAEQVAEGRRAAVVAACFDLDERHVRRICAMQRHCQDDRGNRED